MGAAGACDELLLTGEQLTLLARAAGEPAFPGVRPPALDGAGWEAVANGLRARGIAHDGPAGDSVVHAILGVVLAAERALWLTIAYAPRAGDDRREILWLTGDLLVRQTTTPEGVHRFRTGDVSAARAVVAAVLGTSAHPAQPEATVTAAACAEALSGARRVIGVEVRRRVSEDRFEGEELTLVDSPAHGAWLVRAPGADGPARRLGDAAAAALVTALVAPTR